MTEKIILLGILIITAYTDWKERNVYLHVLAVGGAVGVLCGLFGPGPALSERVGGALIGLAVLVVGWLGKGCIGSGDGLVLAVSGIFLGFWENLLLLLVSLLLAGVAALLLMFLKKGERGLRMPFVPFLLTAYLLSIL